MVGQSSDEEGWERKEHERDSSVCSSASRSNGAAGNAGENADGENEREPTGVTSMCNLKKMPFTDSILFIIIVCS